MRMTFDEAVRAFTRNPTAFFHVLRSFPKMLRLFWRLFWDRRTGWKARCILLVTLAYVASPIDLVPVIPFNVVGLIDDLTVLIFGCQWFLRYVPLHVVDEHMATLGAGNAAPHS